MPTRPPMRPTRRHRERPSAAPGIASAAAVAATGLLGPAALAAPGDLDPSFADVGRWSGLDLDGPLWSLEVQDNNAILFGGAMNTVLRLRLDDFSGRLLPDGRSTGILRGVARQDHRVRHGAAARRKGRRGRDRRRPPPGPGVSPAAERLARCRFGLAGLVPVADTSLDERAARSLSNPTAASSSREGAAANLLVVRLLANGALDPAFGTGGVYVGSTRNVS